MKKIIFYERGTRWVFVFTIGLMLIVFSLVLMLEGRFKLATSITGYIILGLGVFITLVGLARKSRKFTYLRLDEDGLFWRFAIGRTKRLKWAEIYEIELFNKIPFGFNRNKMIGINCHNPTFFQRLNYELVKRNIIIPGKFGADIEEIIELMNQFKDADGKISINLDKFIESDQQYIKNLWNKYTKLFIIVMIPVVIYFGNSGYRQYTNSVNFESVLNKAKAGNVLAQYKIGQAYRRGNHVLQDDKLARKWYLAAAMQDYGDAQFDIGYLYLTETGGERGYTKALFWLKKAAKHENLFAYANIGYIYYRGKGVDVDYKLAGDWFVKSAEKGNAYSQYYLGWMHEQGLGTKVNINIAKKYYQMAADQGYRKAKRRIIELNK